MEYGKQARKLRWCIPVLANDVAAVTRIPEIAAGVTSRGPRQQRLPISSHLAEKLVLMHLFRSRKWHMSYVAEFGRHGRKSEAKEAQPAATSERQVLVGPIRRVTAIRWSLLLIVVIDVS
jgi:hypothetical protein